MNPQASSLPLPSGTSVLPYLPGLLLAGLLAAVSLGTAQWPWLQRHGLGALTMLCSPWLYQLSQTVPALQVSAGAFGLFTGATVHEVAQVIALGHALGPEVAANAIVAKMIRVMLLVPFLFALSGWQVASGYDDGDAAAQKRGAALPWFALAFIALAGVHSTGLLPPSWVAVLLELDCVLLAMAMAGLGMQSKLSALRAAGPKALLLGGLNFVFLMAAGFGLLLFMR